MTLRYRGHTECVVAVQGHSRSLIFAPIESAYATSYWSSIVTLVLSCPISEILQVFCWQQHSTPIPPEFWALCTANYSYADRRWCILCFSTYLPCRGFRGNWNYLWRSLKVMSNSLIWWVILVNVRMASWQFPRCYRLFLITSNASANDIYLDTDLDLGRSWVNTFCLSTVWP